MEIIYILVLLKKNPFVTQQDHCDPLCENPAKVIFRRFTFFCIKSSYIFVKNILWNHILGIFNIDVSKAMSNIEIIVKLMLVIKLWCFKNLLSSCMILQLFFGVIKVIYSTTAVQRTC